MVRLCIVDDDLVFRRGLRKCLEDCPQFVVAGEAEDLEHALPMIAAESPHIVLFDPFSKNKDGIERVVFLRRQYPSGHAVILTRQDLDGYCLAAIEAGAAGYFTKDIEPANLLAALQLIATGSAVAFKPLPHFLTRKKSDPGTAAAQIFLSKREKEILNLAAGGSSNKEIAYKCLIRESTIKVHIRHITEKMRVRNRTQAVATAIEEGLIEPRVDAPGSVKVPPGHIG